MASGGTLTSAYDLGGWYKTLYLEIKSMPSNSALLIQSSRTVDGTYRRVYHPTINSSTVGTNPYTVSSAATSAIVPIPGVHRYLKIEATMAVDNGTTFNIIYGN
jgi:hypothetical protein